MKLTTHTPALRLALLVMMFSYLPHGMNMPVLLSLMILSAIGYRLLVSYYPVPLPSSGIRLGLIALCLALLFWQYGTVWSGQFFIGFLLLFVALKSLELQNLRDLRVIILCNFYLILTNLIVYQELWIFIYLLLAVFANLLLMLKLFAPETPWFSGGKLIVRHMLLAIPITLVVFYLFPRLTNPLWQVPSLSRGQLGFNEELSLDKMNDLFNDDSIVMRVTFKPTFLPTLYWRGIVLSHYDGWRWTALQRDSTYFPPLEKIPQGQTADYQILLEPHQKKWLFYQDFPYAANPNLLYAPGLGLVQPGDREVYQRFAYAVVEKRPFYLPISPRDKQLNTYLPPANNPRLRAFAKQQFTAVQGDTEAFINQLKQYIHSEPFWYSLSVNNPRRFNQMDYFWFEQRRGYCEYYASSVAFILRSVGIPSRVVVGYHGGQWNPMSHYLTVRQNDAHAWIEYWQEGKGWRRLDPTLYIAPERIDRAIRDKQGNALASQWSQEGSLPWLAQTGLFLESLQFFWERWLLFYNYDNQRAFLKELGLNHWDGQTLLKVSIASLLAFLLIGSLIYQWQQYRYRDPMVREYARLKKQLKALGIDVAPPATLQDQLRALGRQLPASRIKLSQYYREYELLRLKPLANRSKRYQQTLCWLKSLSAYLKRVKKRPSRSPGTDR
ncbi:DUF3488 domain-containing protein [Legionella taurinensis]|uniref:DUF3488 domain-containing protein n=1 Tax=Legionella taurinensis TaxID=70611 RepID=A0AB38N566_9GAMM|nr:DUF3488 and transglutaminase-like domain-containing protein [Legionella taurinensis]MDX1837572.1 DUF3488 and transglutaminase-like domain-containing protein [Legionella taurinensis]PUT40904.1 DUF3488 domain-containing protein [Legionella taurinensis]PUT41659.1 DUF3488 domain-containing protein [Legionella taurinensis]PUT44326.1 DUF3488 domain-containing protein [Legionella taurinensis]PUT48767.1 DUF3488 domain-containing protein [Legionella taurinensis]